MHSHSDGEIYGYASTNFGRQVLTSGDDNKIMLWDIIERRLISRGTVSHDKREAESTAISNSPFAANQQSRAVAINYSNGHVAVSNNLGNISIRKSVK